MPSTCSVVWCSCGVVVYVVVVVAGVVSFTCIVAWRSCSVFVVVVVGVVVVQF